MESTRLLNDLKKIAINDEDKSEDYKKILNTLLEKDTTDCVLEAGFVFEKGMIALFKNRNIPDSLKLAYEDSFRDSKLSLYENYLEKVENGEKSVMGFINNLKGKVFEYELPKRLEELYPNYEFKIAEKVNQPTWDIEAIDIEGTENFFIQAKMWGNNPSNLSNLNELMEANPDVMYATSSEIRDAILEKSPELSEQLVPDINISNYDFTNNVQANLETLAENVGLDVPDGIGDILPYFTEVVLGIKLLMDLIEVQRDFKNIGAKNKTKLSAVKVIILFSRFGVTSVCTFIGGAAGGGVGTYIPGIGNIAGGLSGTLGGAILAAKINKNIKPYMLNIALELVGLDDDDMFYLNNKRRIDNLALSFIKCSKKFN
ncbi:MAG: DUF456 domain-containing protein [Firmicutes bacterium]|nr:DUF456 domain-containing protein [Bacillota bacterium]